MTATNDTPSLDRWISKRSSLLELSIQLKFTCPLDPAFAVRLDGGAGGAACVVAVATFESADGPPALNAPELLHRRPKEERCSVNGLVTYSDRVVMAGAGAIDVTFDVAVVDFK